MALAKKKVTSRAIEVMLKRVDSVRVTSAHRKKVVHEKGVSGDRYMPCIARAVVHTWLRLEPAVNRRCILHFGGHSQVQLRYVAIPRKIAGQETGRGMRKKPRPRLPPLLRIHRSKVPTQPESLVAEKGKQSRILWSWCVQTCRNEDLNEKRGGFLCVPPLV